MSEFRLTNPLTVEERLQVTRLIGHDSLNNLDVLSGFSFRKEGVDSNKIEARIRHSASIEYTVMILTQSPEIMLMDNNFSTAMGKSDLANMIDNLSIIHKGYGSINDSMGDFDKLLSEEHILYILLHNLVKNAFIAQTYTEDRTKPINMNIRYSDFPENALFIPDGARDFRRFVVFNVNNGGRSFPKGSIPKNYFTRAPPELGEHGFGLYFTKLVSKFLRAPVNITSEPGNTNVDFYHPVYVS